MFSNNILFIQFNYIFAPIFFSPRHGDNFQELFFTGYFCQNENQICRPESFFCSGFGPRKLSSTIKPKWGKVALSDLKKKTIIKIAERIFKRGKIYWVNVEDKEEN